MIKLSTLLEFIDMDESKASEKAKQMGLDYMDFGRWGKDGKVTHKSKGDTVVPVRNPHPVKEPRYGNYDTPSSPDYLGYDDDTSVPKQASTKKPQVQTKPAPTQPSADIGDDDEDVYDEYSDDAFIYTADTFTARPHLKQINQIIQPYKKDPKRGVAFFTKMQKQFIKNAAMEKKDGDPFMMYKRYVDGAKAIGDAIKMIQRKGKDIDRTGDDEYRTPYDPLGGY